MRTQRALGVGIIGCGTITQACHLPAVTSLTDRLRLVHVTDVDGALATSVASRSAGVKASDSMAELLNDVDVDVVAVCVPDRFHADVVVAACEAGKRAVLCEKPLAGNVEDVDRIAAASTSSGVPVVVATMHRYDPAIAWLESEYPEVFAEAQLVRSTMFVPPNSTMVELASETPAPPADAAPPPDPAVLLPVLPGAWASTTFVHHLPLIRLAMPGPPDAVAATANGVSGAHASLRWGSRLAQLSGIAFRINGLDWSFDILSSTHHVRVEFPASYLAGQSTVASVRSRSAETKVFNSQHETGYRREWVHLADVAEGLCAPLTSHAGAREDLGTCAAIMAAGRALAEPMTSGGALR